MNFKKRNELKGGCTMIMETASRERRIFSRVKFEQSCPDCGSIMREVERIDENGISFIWYNCSRMDCGGHWLERRVAAIRDY
jgi:hypothetical protein